MDEVGTHVLTKSRHCFVPVSTEVRNAATTLRIMMVNPRDYHSGSVHVYVRAYIYVCVCVCVCAVADSGGGRGPAPLGKD